MTKPFQQGPFEQLPALPRVPHAFAKAESRHVPMAALGWPQSTAHVKVLGKGPPLLLIHGLMTSSYSFRYVLEPLGAHFTCYAVDLPGAGATPALNDVEYSALNLGRWVMGVQKALGIEGCLCVANSMGGYIAMATALEHPGAFSRLVNVHSPGLPLLRLNALQTAWGLPGSRSLFRALVRRDPVRWTHRNVHYFDESLKSLEEAREYAAPLQTDAGLEAFRKYLADTMRAGWISHFAKQLKARRDAGQAFPTPLQLLYARKDPMVPSEVGERLRALIPSAEFEWVDDASHFMHVDAPARFLAAALPFLGVAAKAH